MHCYLTLLPRVVNGRIRKHIDMVHLDFREFNFVFDCLEQGSPTSSLGYHPIRPHCLSKKFIFFEVICCFNDACFSFCNFVASQFC